MAYPPNSAGFSSRSLIEEAVARYSARPTDSPVATEKFFRLFDHVYRAFIGGLPSFSVTGVDLLSAGMRSVVFRFYSSADSVIVKYFRRRDSAYNSGGFGYLREKHGLVSLNRLLAGSYPELLYFSDEKRILVIEDVPGESVASLLLGSSDSVGQDDVAARNALSTWVDFWVEMLSAPGQNVSAENNARTFYSARIAAADPLAEFPGTLTSPRLAFRGLEKVCARQGIPVGSPRFMNMQTQVASIIYPAESNQVLTSGDFSPQNVLVSPVSTKLARGIDAEGTAIHHRYLPLAEMYLGFPSSPVFPRYQLAFSDHRDSKSSHWLSLVQNFYERAYSPEPGATLADDPTLAAAVLTIRCILAEQIG